MTKVSPSPESAAKRRLTRARTRRIARQSSSVSLDVSAMVDTAKITNAEAELEGKLPCVIHPHNPRMGYWDGTTGVALIFTAFVTPFEVGFLPPPRSLTDPLFLINRLLDVIFCVDMVFSSLLMYGVKSGGAKGSKVQRSVDAWEHRLSRVCGHYLKGWFVIDLLSVAPSIFDILPLVQDSDSEGGSMESLKVMRNIRTLRLVKLLRIVRGSRVLKRWETRISMPYSTLTLTQLMLIVVYAVHIVACVLGIISDFSTPKPKLDSWQGYFGWCGAGEEAPHGYDEKVQLYDEDTDEPFTCVLPQHMWLQCIGWALMGGRKPKHGPYPDGNAGEEEDPQTFLNHETITLVLLAILLAGMWAYVFSRFVEVIANSNPDQARFNNQVDDLNRFASFHQLPEEMRRRLRAYHIERYQVQLAQARKRVFGNFSEELQAVVAWQINGAWLLRIPVFRSLPKPFLVQVSLNLSSTVYAPKEKPPAQRIYVIFQGCCTYKGQTLTVGETWGQADMAKTSQPLRAIATTYLHVNFVATRTIFELAEKDGTAATLWSIKKMIIFQSIRSYLLDNLRRERRRKARVEAMDRGYLEDDDEVAQQQQQQQQRPVRSIVSPVSVQGRVESLSEEMAEVRRDMQLIKAALGVGLPVAVGKRVRHDARGEAAKTEHTADGRIKDAPLMAGAQPAARPGLVPIPLPPPPRPRSQDTGATEHRDRRKLRPVVE